MTVDTRGPEIREALRNHLGELCGVSGPVTFVHSKRVRIGTEERATIHLVGTIRHNARHFWRKDWPDKLILSQLLALARERPIDPDDFAKLCRSCHFNRPMRPNVVCQHCKSTRSERPAEPAAPESQTVTTNRVDLSPGSIRGRRMMLEWLRDSRRLVKVISNQIFRFDPKTRLAHSYVQTTGDKALQGLLYSVADNCVAIDVTEVARHSQVKLNNTLVPRATLLALPKDPVIPFPMTWLEMDYSFLIAQPQFRLGALVVDSPYEGKRAADVYIFQTQDLDPSIWMRVGEGRFEVNADGAASWTNEPNCPFLRTSASDRDSEAAYVDHVVMMAFKYIIDSISILSCKNVTTREQTDEERKPFTTYFKGGSAPGIRYRVVEINRVGRQRSTSDDLPGGRSVPLHLCRGHFREYTPEAPLFGKLTGRYYIPAHARGSSENGVVDQTYRISP